MGWHKDAMTGAQRAASENTWSKRSKKYKAATFAALTALYGCTKPGHEPKGITTVRETKHELGNNMDERTKGKTQEA